jgi:hypothetical protein
MIKIGILLICFFLSFSLTPITAIQNIEPEHLIESTIPSINDNETIATFYVINSSESIIWNKSITTELGSKLVNQITNPSKNIIEKKSLSNIFINENLIDDPRIPEKIESIFDVPFHFKIFQQLQLKSIITTNVASGSSFFCTIVSGGSGRTMPIVILPRPRIYLHWQGYEDNEFSITTVGGLLNNKGFIASGGQTGFALGFTGIGITYGTPFGTVYGFTGYALYTNVKCDNIEFYPPNNKPIISSPNPENNQEDIPLNLEELQVHIEDPDNDLMSYTVSSHPDIGSKTGNNKQNGLISIPISGLEASKTYSWTVSVFDGKDSTDTTYTFSTVKENPIVLNPNPSDYGSIGSDITRLEFTLYDPQNDNMDFTVETAPYIGYKEEFSVSNGIYYLPISELQDDILYHWFINVTDGFYSSSYHFHFFTGDLGLVSVWKFDEGIGNSVSDLIGKNNGIIHKASWTTDTPSGNGFALDFERDNECYIEFSNPVLNKPPYSICIWVKPESLPNNDNWIFISNGGETGHSYGFYMFLGNKYYSETCWQYGSKDSSGWGSAIYTPYKSPDWTFLCGTWDGSLNTNSNKFYVNGELIISGTPIEKPFDESQRNLMIGKDSEGQGTDNDKSFFDGIIDEVRIYNKVLNGSEIIDIYNEK